MERILQKIGRINECVTIINSIKDEYGERDCSEALICDQATYIFDIIALKKSGF